MENLDKEYEKFSGNDDYKRYKAERDRAYDDIIQAMKNQHIP